MLNSLWPQGLYSPWNCPGQNTGVGRLPLLQGIFPTQASCITGGFFYQLSHKRSPRILAWVAYSFSSGSSQPRNQSRVSCITGGFFTRWDIREDINIRAISEKRLFRQQSRLRWHFTLHDKEIITEEIKKKKKRFVYHSPGIRYSLQLPKVLPMIYEREKRKNS